MASTSCVADKGPASVSMWRWGEGRGHKVLKLEMFLDKMALREPVYVLLNAGVTLFIYFSFSQHYVPTLSDPSVGLTLCSF